MKKIIMNDGRETLTVSAVLDQTGIIFAKALEPTDDFSPEGWYVLRQRDQVWRWYSLTNAPGINLDMSPHKDAQINGVLLDGHEVLYFEGGLAEWLEYAIGV